VSHDDKDPRPDCERYGGDLAELALGILTGRDRALALAHVEGCPACQGEVEQLSLAADSMLEAVPGVEPPLGFETRLMDGLRAGRTGRARLRPGRHLRLSPLVVGCLLFVAAVGVGTGAGWLARGATKQPTPVANGFGTEAGGRFETASLLAGGRELGSVTVYSGKKSWLFMSLYDGSWSGKATCLVRLADGTSIALGTFWLDGGYGAWGVSLPSGTGRIRSASVVTDGGVLASARFPSGAATRAAKSASGLIPNAGANWARRSHLTER